MSSIRLYLKQSRNMVETVKIYHPQKMKMHILLLTIKYESRTELGQMTPGPGDHMIASFALFIESKGVGMTKTQGHADRREC